MVYTVVGAVGHMIPPVLPVQEELLLGIYPVGAHNELDRHSPEKWGKYREVYQSLGFAREQSATTAIQPAGLVGVFCACCQKDNELNANQANQIPHTVLQQISKINEMSWINR